MTLRLQTLHITIANNCKHLTEISASGATDVTDTGLIALAQRLPCLTVLDLSWCDNITDNAVNALATCCVFLRVVALSYSNITGDGVRALLTGCPRINTLRFEQCFALSDTAVQHTVWFASRRLVEVNLASYKRLGDAAVLMLLHSCANLGLLDVAHTPTRSIARILAPYRHPALFSMRSAP